MRRSRMRSILPLVAFSMLWLAQNGAAQFSPGDLSRPHMHLEGTNNCAQCHEVGKEITGAKCLTCHTEIKTVIGEKHGYHFASSAQKCIACHKEHLGRDARTMTLRETDFDHTSTGFSLSGKHMQAKCDQCHTRRNIKDNSVLELVAKTGRKTHLGLKTDCASCHQDRHKGEVGSDCNSCHTTNAWMPAVKLDHSRTEFPLSGKHMAVTCVKCHTGLQEERRKPAVSFATQAFADCTPCHTTPHGRKFNDRQCNSCHSPESWTKVSTASFDHTMTDFKLVGRHAEIKCEQCHKERAAGKSIPRTRLRHEQCIDCHNDYHRSQFTPVYANDCKKCHTENGFRPSTFSLEQHARARFSLSGAHAATPCANCHKKSLNGGWNFKFTDLRCESCHTDNHDGQFGRRMAEKSCATCHATSSWKPAAFDHSSTSFSLAGKHALVSCTKCHLPETRGRRVVVQYRNAKGDCQSCHRDTHAGQFAANGTTECKQCHIPEGWKSLAFDHNTRSSFSLTGAHAKVECWKCHAVHEVDGVAVRRFKPLPTACESCHAGGVR